MIQLFSTTVLSLAIVSSSFAAPAKAPAKPAAKPVAPKVPEAPKPPPFTVSKALTPYVGLYQILNTQSIWIQNGALSPQVAGLRAGLMQNPAAHGLNPAAYWTAELEEMFQNFTPEKADAFELAATKAYVTYASDLSIGRVDPVKVSDEIRINRKAVPYDLMAEALKNTTAELAATMESFAPQWQAYRDLKAALVRLAGFNEENFPAIKAPKKNLKIGASDPAFAAAKMRLQTLGYAISETGPVYTKELSAAVSAFYTLQTIPGTVTLNADSSFWKNISVTAGERIQQVRMNMEKLRWMPHAPEDRFGFVNLAQQRIRVFEGGNKVIDMRTINGRSKRKSPMIKDKITLVELNPDWTVPTTLVVEDKAPAILRDPDFLWRGNYVIVDQNNRPLDQWQIPWESLTKQNANWFYIKQEPGLGNALGIMKFHLTNPYAIYLHDTNERNLFTENHRLLSSGCVRLERPLELAEYLLRGTQWDRSTIEDNLATQPLIESWKKRKNQIPLKQPMAVYLIYMTADATAGEPLKFAVDYYGQDTAVYNALKNVGR